MIVLSSTLNSFIQLLGALVIFAFVLILTYFTTKWIGGFQKSHMTSENLSIIETMRIANNQYVQIIKTGDTYLVIAIGKDYVTKLTELTEEQIKGTEEQRENGDPKNEVSKESFQEILNKFKEHFPKKQD